MIDVGKDVLNKIRKNLWRLDEKEDEEIAAFFEKWVEEQKCFKYDIGQASWAMLNILSDGKRIKAVFFSEYQVPEGLSLMLHDVFSGALPHRCGYLTYRTFTGAKWLDILVRPRAGYSEVKEIYFVRLGIHDDGEPIDKEQIEEFLAFLMG